MLVSASNEVIIAVMGVTGAGKSTFINRALGTEKAYISHRLQPGTHEVKSYRLMYNKTSFVLVDTPGFDDTNVSDADILRTLLQWLQESYHAGQKLTAILYLHRITDTRMQGSALRNFTMFKKLCGEGCFANVVLGTTFWGSVAQNPGIAIAEHREKELVETKQFWGGMIEKGSEVVRIPEHQQAALQLLFRLANKSKITLQAQEELGSNNNSFEQTAASRALSEEIKKERAEAERAKKRMQEEHEYRLKLIEEKRKAEEEARRKEHERRVAEKERERIRMEKERERLEAERNKREEDAKREAERMRREQQELEERMAKLRIDRENEARSRKNKQFCAEVEEWIVLLGEGKAAGRVLCNFRDPRLVYNRICDHCSKSIGAATYYQCNVCADGEFMLCQACHAAPGVYCDDSDHFGSMQKHEETDTQGNCPRVMCPYPPDRSLSCDRCSGPTGVVYLHCCFCNNDQFDMCIKCALAGRTCKKPWSLSGHPLDICSRYIE